MNKDSSKIHINPIALCAKEHLHYGVIATDVNRQSDKMFVPVTLSEISEITRYYPILFLNDEVITPIAILRANLLKPFHSSTTPSNRLYQPSILQLYPFMLEELPEKDAGLLLFQPESRQVVPIHQESRAQRLFDDSGTPTALLQQIAAFSAKVYQGRKVAMEFARALRNAGLLVPSLLEFKEPTANGERTRRLYTVNTVALRSLSKDIVHEWFSNEWLEALFLIKLSQERWNIAVS